MRYLTKINGKFDDLSKQILSDLPDGKYEIDKRKTKRSIEQNAYIHAVIFPLIKDFFNDNRKEGTPELDIDDIKDWVREKGYWGYKQVGKATIPKRSSETNTLEMMGGIEKLQRDFANWGLVLPDPNQENFI